MEPPSGHQAGPVETLLLAGGLVYCETGENGQSSYPIAKWDRIRPSAGPRESMIRWWSPSDLCCGRAGLAEHADMSLYMLGLCVLGRAGLGSHCTVVPERLMETTPDLYFTGAVVDQGTSSGRGLIQGTDREQLLVAIDLFAGRSGRICRSNFVSVTR